MVSEEEGLRQDREDVRAAEAALAEAEGASSELAREVNDLIDAICVFRVEGSLLHRVEEFDPWSRRISKFLWGDESRLSEVFECVCDVEGSFAGLCAALEISVGVRDVSRARGRGGRAGDVVEAVPERCASCGGAGRRQRHGRGLNARKVWRAVGPRVVIVV